MIITDLKTIDRYRNLSSAFASACDYLKTLDLATVTPGEINIAEGVRASCIDYVADGVPGEQFENHHDWADIHFVTRNAEQMAVTSIDSVSPLSAYDAARDIAFFTGKPEQIVDLYPGNALITFPEDLHQPKIRVNDRQVRKVCMKVRL